MSHFYVRRGGRSTFHVAHFTRFDHQRPHALCGQAPPDRREWTEVRRRLLPDERVCRHCRAILLDRGETP